MQKSVLKSWGMHGLCALTMVLSVSTLTPVCARAVEPEVIREPDASVDNDALFGQYLDNLMETGYGISADEYYTGSDTPTYYNSGRSALTKYGKKVYDYLVGQLKMVANGELDTTRFSIPYSEIYGEDETFTFTAEELGMDRITDENLNTVESKISDLMHDKGKEPGLGEVKSALLADVPYYLYWSDGGGGSSPYPRISVVSYKDDSVTVKPSEGETYSFDYGFEVERNYAKNPEAYEEEIQRVYADYYYEVNTNKTAAGKKALDYAVEIVKQAEGMTDTEKLAYYKKAICELVDYDYEADVYENMNPWQIVYVFDQDKSTKAVCEGYAKAYKFLCDLTKFSSPEIECRLATGDLEINGISDSHMWTIVQLKENENYLVDVTNCDDGMFGAPDILYMRGGSEKVNKKIRGVARWGYRVGHPTDTVCYYYDRSDTNKLRNENELILVEDQSIQPTPEPTPDPTPDSGLTPVQQFVTRLYEVGLGRAAEEKGLNDWSSQLESGEKNAVDVVKGILCSPEYLNKGKTNEQMVTDCYRTMLNREPDEGGFNNWVSNLNSGMSVNAIFAGFVGSKEFATLCDSYGIKPGTFELTEERDKNAGVTKFVSRLYTQALGRNYDVAGLNDWCGKINANPSRSNILNVSTDGFFHSQEFGNKGLNNTEFVKVLYRTFLGREYDDAGLADWVGQLDRGEKDRDGVTSGFANSPEFSNIMAQYGL